MRRTSVTGVTGAAAAALAPAVLGVAFAVGVLRSGDRYGAWTMLAGMGVAVLFGWRFGRLSGLADGAVELATERDEVRRLQLELAERHGTIGQLLDTMAKTSATARQPHAGGDA